jgi:hypothetical protein
MFARSSHGNCNKTKTLGGLKPYGIDIETGETVANKFSFLCKIFHSLSVCIQRLLEVSKYNNGFFSKNRRIFS